MKKFLVALALALCFMLMPFNAAIAGSKKLAFRWTQIISPDFYGWKIWFSETSGGPYDQFGEDIIYDGSPVPAYSANKVFTSPDGESKTYYFVASAWDTGGNGSDYSNEINAEIDFLAPNVPVTFTVVVQPVP